MELVPALRTTHGNGGSEVSPQKLGRYADVSMKGCESASLQNVFKFYVASTLIPYLGLRKSLQKLLSFFGSIILDILQGANLIYGARFRYLHTA